MVDRQDIIDACAVGLLAAARAAAPVDVNELVQRLSGENPDWGVSLSELRAIAQRIAATHCIPLRESRSSRSSVVGELRRRRAAVGLPL